MPRAKHIISGMSNRIDPLSIPTGVDSDRRTPLLADWYELTNVDVDSSGGGALRNGYQISSAGSSRHSLWSNPYNPQDSYFVEDRLLVIRKPSGLTVTIRNYLTPGLRMFFTQVNDVVVYSNGVESGIIENGYDSTAPEIIEPYKKPFPVCRLLEWYNGRLYGGLNDGGNALIYSDSLDSVHGIESIDERAFVAFHFETPLTMIQRVSGGMYVSDGGETFFISGDDPHVEMGGLSIRPVDRWGAVLGTNCPVLAKHVGEGGSGYGAFWVAGDRVCYGSPTGEIAVLDKVAVPYAAEGSGLIREQNGLVHYVCTLSAANTTGNVYVPQFIDVEEH